MQDAFSPLARYGSYSLRLLRESDRPRTLECMADWETVRWLARVPYPYTDAGAEEWYAKVFANDRTQPPFFFVIADEHDRLSGGISVHTHERTIGYWLSRPLWGKGIMSWALREHLKFIFDSYEFKNVRATTDPDNMASRRVLEKAGFVFQSLLPREADTLRGPDQVCDYFLSREQFTP